MVAYASFYKFNGKMSLGFCLEVLFYNQQKDLGFLSFYHSPLFTRSISIFYVTVTEDFERLQCFNPLMPDGNKKVPHT